MPGEVVGPFGPLNEIIFEVGGLLSPGTVVSLELIATFGVVEASIAVELELRVLGGTQVEFQFQGVLGPVVDGTSTTTVPTVSEPAGGLVNVLVMEPVQVEVKVV